jgi:hypothetical protein
MAGNSAHPGHSGNEKKAACDGGPHGFGKLVLDPGRAKENGG